MLVLRGKDQSYSKSAVSLGVRASTAIHDQASKDAEQWINKEPHGELEGEKEAFHQITS